MQEALGICTYTNAPHIARHLACWSLDIPVLWPTYVSRGVLYDTGVLVYSTAMNVRKRKDVLVIYMSTQTVIIIPEIMIPCTRVYVYSNRAKPQSFLDNNFPPLHPHSCYLLQIVRYSGRHSGRKFAILPQLSWRAHRSRVLVCTLSDKKVRWNCMFCFWSTLPSSLPLCLLFSLLSNILYTICVLL